jgi:flagellar biosynthesis protein FliR
LLTVSSQQIDAMLAGYFMPFVRVGAFLMLAPLFGAVFVPVRIRLVLALAVSVLIVPLLPAAPDLRLMSLTAIVVVIQQLLIGAACGFVLQLMFDAVGLGGQLLANTMGLSFAFNVDPQRGAATPALGRFYMVIATLTFLALDGHLRLLELVIGSFQGIPVGTAGLGVAGLGALLAMAKLLFSGALAVALPGVAALLIVNLAFGVMSRAAPALNLFAIGFPLILMLGLLILLIGLPTVQAAVTTLVDNTLLTLAAQLRDPR